MGAHIPPRITLDRVREGLVDRDVLARTLARMIDGPEVADVREAKRLLVLGCGASNRSRRAVTELTLPPDR